MTHTARKLWAIGAIVALTPLIAAESASAFTSTADAASTAARKPVASPQKSPDFAATLAAKLGISRSAAASRVAAQDRALKSAAKLGSKFGGAYIDSTGSLVVGVTGASGAARPQASGVETRVVQRSWSSLQSVKSALDKQAGVAGTSWGLDARANKVVITIAANADKAKVDRLLATARRFGSAVSVERIAGQVSTASPLIGGYPIYQGSGGRCSAGFNVKYGSTPYVLTAGHCTAGYPYWYNYDHTAIGPSVSSYFPTRDFGLIRDYYATPYPGVYLWNGYYQPTPWAAYAYAGLNTCKSGSTTGLTCGTVLRTNVTVNYSGQVVYGLDETNLCVERGDSGGSHFTGGYALGVTSGAALKADGHCLGGTSSRSWFQPVVPALSYYGVSLA